MSKQHVHVYFEKITETPDDDYKNKPFILDEAFRVYIEKDNAVFLSNKYIEKGEKEQYEKKNIPEAIRHYENALQVVKHGSKLFETKNTPIGLKVNLRDIHSLLTNAYQIVGKKTESFEHSKEAVKIQETIKMNDFNAGASFYQYAMHLFEKKRFDEANVYVKECLKSMHARLGVLTSCFYVRVYMGVGTVCFGEKHYDDQCLDFSKKAIYIALQIQKHKKCQDSGCGDCDEYAGPENVAKTHLNLAQILAKLQKHEEALHEFIRAFKVRAEHKLPLKDILEHLDSLIKKGCQNPKFMAALQQLQQQREYRDAQKAAAQTALVRHTSEMACATCLRTGVKLLVCSQCFSVRYCSTECQKKDWAAAHKPRCLAIVKEKKAQEQREKELLQQQEDNDADPTND